VRLALLLGLLAPAHHGSFPCQWRYDLQAGLRSGYVTAGASAACAGRSGALTISVHLQSWNAKTRRWRKEAAQTQTWRNLAHNRYVVLARPCRAEIVRADFHWTLRDSGGSVVARNSVQSGRLSVPGPKCQIQLR
jgi:hypothetical protein